MELIYRSAHAFRPSRREAVRVGVESCPCRIPSPNLVVELGDRVTLSAGEGGWRIRLQKLNIIQSMMTFVKSQADAVRRHTPAGDIRRRGATTVA